MSLIARIQSDKEQQETYEALLAEGFGGSRFRESSASRQMPTLLEIACLRRKYTSEYTDEPELVSEADYRQAFLRALIHKLGCYWVYRCDRYENQLSDSARQRNEYYLTHSLYKKKSSAARYLRTVRCLPNYSENYNMLMYGHCMNNGTMFRGLKTWFDSVNRVALAESMEIKV
jgi:hypothetical protein